MPACHAARFFPTILTFPAFTPSATSLSSPPVVARITPAFMPTPSRSTSQPWPIDVMLTSRYGPLGVRQTSRHWELAAGCGVDSPTHAGHHGFRIGVVKPGATLPPCYSQLKLRIFDGP